MVDKDPRAQKLAQELVGPYSEAPIDLVIFSTPLEALPEVVAREFALNPQAVFIDTGSVKTKPQQIVESSLLPIARFCPTHPMAGREYGGAESAQGDLFVGRPWICDFSQVDHDVRQIVSELIHLCEAHLIEMDSVLHDKAVALVSHLPQIVASLLAKQLIGAPESSLEIAGSGLRDTTRIAGSDPELWAQILHANSGAISPLLHALRRDLDELIEHFDETDSLYRFIDDGRRGRGQIPGKHGGKARSYTYVPIVIDDRPGQLHRIFNECAAVSVNVEDLSIEHSPGQEKGLVTLAMSQEDAEKFSHHMSDLGWSVHPWRS